MKRQMIKSMIVIGVTAVLLVFGITAGYCGQTKALTTSGQKEPKGELYEQVELFSEALSTIRSDFVDEVESKKMIYGALRGMLSHMDDYSQFMDPDEYKDIRAETKGEFGGVGIEISMRDRVLTVITPIVGSPAEKQGIISGDRIVKINGEITRGITLSGAVKKLRGEPGTPVNLTIWREKEDRVLEVTIVRDIIKIDSIKKVQLIEGKIGYIKLVEFQEKTARDLEKALQDLTKQGMDSLILDLRNNPGGLLDASVAVSEKFLSQGTMIVSTKARIKSQNAEFKSRNSTPYTNFPMVVLVNKGSASASEITAGAIQDNKRGIVVGTTTFGKGSVQTIIPLKDSSALRLTTASYFTPSGRSIRGAGIIPDVVVEREKIPEPPPSKSDIFKRLEKNTDKKEEEKIIQEAEQLLDNQLQRAVDVLKAIKVYRTFGSYAANKADEPGR